MPAAAVAEIQTRREAYERGETAPPTYQEIWTWITRFNSGDPKQEALKACGTLHRTTREVTSEVWLEFHTEFAVEPSTGFRGGPGRVV